FTGASGARHHDHAVRPVDQRLDCLEVTFAHAEVLQLECFAAFVQEPHYDLFAPYRRNGADAEVHLGASFLHAKVAVLRPAVFRGVHVGHDFDAGDHSLFDVVRDRHHRLKLAIDAITDAHFRYV